MAGVLIAVAVFAEIMPKQNISVLVISILAKLAPVKLALMAKLLTTLNHQEFYTRHKDHQRPWCYLLFPL